MKGKDFADGKPDQKEKYWIDLGYFGSGQLFWEENYLVPYNMENRCDIIIVANYCRKTIICMAKNMGNSCYTMKMGSCGRQTIISMANSMENS